MRLFRGLKAIQTILSMKIFYLTLVLAINKGKVTYSEVILQFIKINLCCLKFAENILFNRT